ncbi:MAG: heavy metal-associated domain-containing protein [Sediminibacterium sp.]|nr:heavy metal-associated domain-containing protein [Sediminibacterium sp.]
MKSISKLIIVFLINIIIISTASARIISAKLKVNGLTCSMCSKATHKTLSKISFIESINPDLENTSFTLTFKQNADINLSEIKNSIEKAGFSVGELILNLDQPLTSENEVKIGNQNLLLINNKSGSNEIKVLGHGFLSNKEWDSFIKKQTGTIIVKNKLYLEAL